MLVSLPLPHLTIAPFAQFSIETKREPTEQVGTSYNSYDTNTDGYSVSLASTTCRIIETILRLKFLPDFSLRRLSFFLFMEIKLPLD